MDRESAVTLTGTVEDVVFYNEDNGYIVVDLDCGGELVTVVGNLGDVREGESLTLLGEYINSAEIRQAVQGGGLRAEPSRTPRAPCGSFWAPALSPG